MSRSDAQSTRLHCVTAGCKGSLRVVKGATEAADELVCPSCSDSWARDTWPVLAGLVRARERGAA